MSAVTPLKIILATKSEYKKTQFATLQLPFETANPNIDESQLTNEHARDMAERLSALKALAVEASSTKGQLIIGCDQSATCEGQILGKPGTKQKAIEQLHYCSNKIANFYSAVTILNTQNGISATRCTQTQVQFKNLTPSQISHYLDRENTLNCAGSFKCEGLGIALFKSIHSKDPSALIGLPLIDTCHLLAEHGIDVI